MKSLNLDKIDELVSTSLVAREVRLLEQERLSWAKAMAQTDSLAEQMKKLVDGNAIAALTKLQSSSLADAAKKLGENSPAVLMAKQWQEAEQARRESMRKMLEPLQDIRKSLLLDSSTKRLADELSAVSRVSDHYKSLIEQATGASSFAKIISAQAEAATEHTRKLLDNLSTLGSVQTYLKGFEEANRHWAVPSDVLGAVGSLRALQERLGSVSLPVIDWGSAGALAKLIGSQGIESQLALLGIGPDGELETREATQQERGLLSRKQADVVALISLLLAILFFLYQEHSANQWQAQVTEALHQQAKQIESLNLLIESVLIQATKESEKRFVVRERAALVRSAPEHGSTVDGKLLPRELVRAISERGKWIEVEYYHWLNEEYHTGWVLKKYLQRVPANFSESSSSQERP